MSAIFGANKGQIHVTDSRSGGQYPLEYLNQGWAGARENGRDAVVLLVDNDPGDQELTRRALNCSSLKVDLRLVEDGEQAIDYLFRRGSFEDPRTSPRPDLVLLDLNMPKKNGCEVLAELRQNKTCARIPVVVLTTSQQETDVLRSYDLGCNSYIQKPVDLDQFVDSVRNLGTYWLRIVTLPSIG